LFKVDVSMRGQYCQVNQRRMVGAGSDYQTFRRFFSPCR
jgi:hypothetical protein